MSNRDERLKDLILLAFGIQLTVIPAVIPQLFPLAALGILIAVAVAITEGARRYDVYTNR